MPQRLSSRGPLPGHSQGHRGVTLRRRVNPGHSPILIPTVLEKQPCCPSRFCDPLTWLGGPRVRQWLAASRA